MTYVSSASSIGWVEKNVGKTKEGRDVFRKVLVVHCDGCGDKFEPKFSLTIKCPVCGKLQSPPKKDKFNF